MTCFRPAGAAGPAGPADPADHARRAPLLALLALSWLSHAAFAASPAKLALAHQRLDLPGVPVQTIAVDLDRDGRRDLAVVVASTSWGEVGFDEPMAVDDTGTFVDVLTVVPTLLDRRELLVFFAAGPGGGFASEPVRLELPTSVHALAAGPPAAPLVAWTDDGVAEVVMASPADSAEVAPGRALALESRIAERTIFAGSESYVSRSGLIADLDGDGDLDLFVPVAAGLAVHLSTEAGLEARAASIVEPLPDEDEASVGPETASKPVAARSGRGRRGVSREVLLPEPIDLNGDGRPDLLFHDRARDGDGIRLRLNLGEGRYGAAFDPLPGWGAAEPAVEKEDAPRREVVWLGDLDGDGEAEVVTSQELSSGKDSMRAELKEAKRPTFAIQVHELGPDGRWNPTAKAKFKIEGYVFEGGERRERDGGDEGEGGGFALAFPSGVRDLDGDGKLDLVALTLDFSLFEAMRVLATKSFKLGLDFGIYRQGEGLAFRPVTGLDLAGELRLRLDSVSLGQLSSFSGDFDGDGRADFVQLGRGRKVAIHRGQPGARYAPAPDLVVTLEREPLDVALVAVSDLDGDGRSDICVTQPVGGKAIGARAALDLYLSAGAPAAGVR